MFASPSSHLTRVLLLSLALCAPRLAGGAEEEKKPETLVTVSVTSVVRATVHATVTAYGTVETAPAAGASRTAGGARLAASASGLVVAVAATEGQRVEKGAVLVQLDARAADAAVTRAQAGLTAALQARARQTRLLAAEGTSERAVQEAEEKLAAARAELSVAQLQQSQLAVRAPLGGIVARLTVKPGEWLDAGKDVAEIIDPDRLVVTVQVPSTEARAVQAGQTAAIYGRLGATEKPLTTGTVQFVSPVVLAANDTVLTRLALPQASGVRPGQFVAARIVTEERADRLVVPAESISTDAEGHSTIAIVEGDLARQKPVQVGLREGALVEISGEGVGEGAKVVTVGAYGLPKETKVRVLAPATEAGK
jgi:membrane fusion protein (multidrug efflux system)